MSWLFSLHTTFVRNRWIGNSQTKLSRWRQHAAKPGTFMHNWNRNNVLYIDKHSPPKWIFPFDLLTFLRSTKDVPVQLVLLSFSLTSLFLPYSPPPPSISHSLSFFSFLSSLQFHLYSILDGNKGYLEKRFPQFLVQIYSPLKFSPSANAQEWWMTANQTRLTAL